MTSKQSRESIVPRNISIPIDEVATAATTVLTSNNTQTTNGKIVTIGTRAYTAKTTLTGAIDEFAIGADADATLGNLKALINLGRAAVAASGVLTASTDKPTAGKVVVVGAKTYTFVAALTEAYATATLTASTGNPTAGKTVTVGDITYEFVASLIVDRGHGQSDPLEIPNRVLIGANYDATLANLVAAINGAAGEGTTYSYGTVANPKVTAGAVGSHASIMTAKTIGVVGNAIAKAENDANLDWDGTGAFFTGGLDPVANEVSLVGADYGVVLQNLIAAINGAAGSGTKYSSNTVASTQMTAVLTSAYVMTVTAKVAGIAGNAFAKTTDETNLDWDGVGAVMTGGVDASSVNAQVTAGDVTAHAITLTAKTAGFEGNAIATTTDEATYSFTSTVMAGGGYTTGTSDEIGDGGGLINEMIIKAPQLTGTPTYTVSVIDSSGIELYTSDAQDENETTLTSLGWIVSSTDKIKIVCSALVESTLPFSVYLR